MKTKSLMLFVSVLLLGLTNLFAQTANSKSYQVTFKTIPTSGSGPEKTSIISGRVTGPDASSLQIIIYAKGGDKWWIQPTTENPLTMVSNDGTWQNETHLGTQYAAILVKKSFKPGNTLNNLPQPDDSVLSISVVNAKQ